MPSTGIASFADLGAVVRENLTVLNFFLGMMALTALAEVPAADRSGSRPRYFRRPVNK